MEPEQIRQPVLSAERIDFILFCLNQMARQYESQAWQVVTANKSRYDEFGIPVKRGERYFLMREPFQYWFVLSFHSAEILIKIFVDFPGISQKMKLEQNQAEERQAEIQRHAVELLSELIDSNLHGVIPDGERHPRND